MRGKLLVTSLWNYIMLWVNEPPPKRNNNGRTRGTPTISVALGLVRIQLCQVSSRPKFKLVCFHRQYGNHKEVLHWAVIATVLESQQHTQCSTACDWLTSCDYVFVFFYIRALGGLFLVYLFYQLVSH